MREIKSGIKMMSRASRYPWLDMEVGDCFEVSTYEVKTVRLDAQEASVNGATFRVLRKKDGKYACWMVEDNRPQEEAPKPSVREVRAEAVGELKKLSDGGFPVSFLAEIINEVVELEAENRANNNGRKVLK
mgnify:CR=1 FL=1|tara:strand:- start:47 stop:439 length:393 start_codon:yes stop_codon:yes gene_type:complete